MAKIEGTIWDHLDFEKIRSRMQDARDGEVVNPFYKPLFESNARWRVLFGSAGSGKSFSAHQMRIDRAAKDPNYRGLVVRKTMSSCRNSTYSLLREIADNLGYEYKSNSHYMDLRFPSGGEIIHAGMDNAERLKSISLVTDILCEEATELSFPADGRTPDLAQLSLRLRGVPEDQKPHLCLLFNPVDSANKIFRFLGVDIETLPFRAWKEENGVLLGHSTYKDNPALDDEYIKDLERLSGNTATIYVKGVLTEDAGHDRLVPYEWIDAALERKPNADGVFNDRVKRLSLDPSGGGASESTILGATGYSFDFAKVTRADYEGEEMKRCWRQYGTNHDDIVLDTSGGLGYRTAQAMRKEGMNPVQFEGGRPLSKEMQRMSFPRGVSPIPLGMQFRRIRDAAFYYTRLQFEDRTISLFNLPDNVKKKLREELGIIKFRVKSERYFQVEPKRVRGPGRSKEWGIIKRLGRSPDWADTLSMLLFMDYLSPIRLGMKSWPSYSGY